MSGTSKANQRQSKKHEAFYKQQKDKTPVNKVIKVLRHVTDFNDKKTLDRLRQTPQIDLKRAQTKMKHSASSYSKLLTTLQQALT